MSGCEVGSQTLKCLTDILGLISDTAQLSSVN